MIEVEKMEHNGCTITIWQEEYTDDFNPRQYDNVGVMFAEGHRRYILGDLPYAQYVPDYENVRALFEETRRRNMELDRFFRALSMFYGTTVILPLWLLDHSGLAMQTGSFAMDTAHWDSGIVGWIFDTWRTRDAIGIKKEDVGSALVDEVRRYNAFLQGQVLGYTVERDGDEVDCCGGYLIASQEDYDDMIGEAKDACGGD